MGCPSDANIRTFGAKTFGFFEIYGVSSRTRGEGIKPVRTFCGQGEGVNFSRFCADIFYGRPQSLLLSTTLMPRLNMQV